MPESAWNRLRAALGWRTSYPPPRTGGDAAGLKRALQEFHAHDAERFWKLFLGSRPLAVEESERAWFARFAGAGLVRRLPLGAHAPCVRVFPLHGAMIATDLLAHRGEDQVFSLMLEQVYIVAELGVRAGDRALELCVGSGVNSLFLADVAASVTAIDLSPRALAFARFNIALNPGGAPIELKQGSLFEPLGKDERFDLVVVNPPFELVPEGTGHFLHSHGGEDGLDVVRDILEDAPARLAPGGRFEMFTWTPGDEESVLLADLLVAAFPDRSIEIQRVDRRPLDERIAQFRKAKGFAAWRERLRARGFTQVWGVYARVHGEGPAGVEMVEYPDVLRECAVILDEWA